jgi:hypothetical protein
MTDTAALHERLFRDDAFPREEPLAGPRRCLDPWIVSYGWVDSWVLDMCDRGELPDWRRDAPAPRSASAGLVVLVARAADAVRRLGGRRAISRRG